jgi:hypothetical protein
MKGQLQEIAAELRRCADVLEKGAEGEGKLGTAVCHHCGREFSNWHNTCPDCGALAPGVYSYRISPAPNAATPKPVPGVVLTTAVTKDRVVLASVDSIGLSWLPEGLGAVDMLLQGYDDIYVEVWGGQFGGGKDSLRTATAVDVIDACREAGMDCPTPVLHLTATCAEKLEVPVDEVRRVIACRSHDHDGTLCASKTIVRRTGKREVLGWECREPADVVRRMCQLCGREVGSGE